MWRNGHGWGVGDGFSGAGVLTGTWRQAPRWGGANRRFFPPPTVTTPSPHPRVDTVNLMGLGLRAAAAAHLSGSSGRVQGSALFGLASMLNHSCEPCLDVQWPRNSAAIAFRAARDVAAGEQLTISYIPPEQPVAQRQQALHQGYGFWCRCSKCVEELGDRGAGAQT